ncbi:TonB-dependent receptor [Flavobacterium sp.]|uniref:TonB-dependent receptor n=1 Tax=Flavobacterium sp. TaxID=239 RepID=UPI002FD87D02
MSKKIWVILLFQFLYLGLRAQEVTVLDALTHEKLEAVTLNTQQPKVSAVSNSQGIVRIDSFKNLKKIYVRILGYETQILSYNQIVNAGNKLYLTPESTSLNEVLVSVSKWEETRKRVPNYMTTFKPKDIILNNPQTAADMVNATGKVFMQKSQLGGGSPMIRGFATNRVLINVDGIRMNNAIFRSGNIQNIISIDANSIHNLEIILGPGTVIYGSDAIGGVMNFYTLEPKINPENYESYSGNALSRWSSANNEKSLHFDLNVTQKKWSFLTSATFSDYDDLRMGTNGPRAYTRPDFIQTVNGIDEIVENSNPNKQITSAYSQTNFIQKIRFKPSESFDFIYNFHYSETSDFARYDQLLRRRNGNLRFAEWYYGPQKWMMHHFKLNILKSTKWYDKALFNVAYQKFEESRNNRNFGSSIRNRNFEEVDAYSVSFDFIKRFSDQHKMSYGVEYILNDISSIGRIENIETLNSTPAPSRYPNGSNWQSLAAYFQYENKLSNRFTLQSGFRFNQIWLDAQFDQTFVNYPFEKTEINTSAFTGSFGFTYLPKEKTALFFNLSTAFRSPNIDDIGKTYESTPGNVVVPNPKLSYEYAYNAEIGLQQKIGSHIGIDIATFYTYVVDALVRRNFQFNGEDTLEFQGEMSQVQAIQNAANARVYGFQAGINVDLLPTLQWKSNLNWTKGEEELDNGERAPLRHAAPFFADTRLTLKSKHWTHELVTFFNSKIKFKDLAPSEIEKEYLYATDSNGNPYVPSWYTLNYKSVFKLNSSWTFSGGIENITDIRYRPYSSGITAPGRNFILAVKTSF